MPVREKRQKEPSRDQLLPSHVPGHPQTTAKVPGFSPTPPGCTAEIDSPLEGAGFEASVPREIGHDFEDASSYDGGLGERPAPRAGSTDRIYTTGLPGAL
jgi:hypothetical protein